MLGVMTVVEAEPIDEDTNFVCGATANNEKIHSQKNSKIQKIIKDYGITRDILVQQFGLTRKDAAISLKVSTSTLKH
ncbi:hypothetical protein K7X08_032153 [Anisodus acutangulus]|uniref:Uncharacterized protein n=1 Tax=Anisodus acutangulus TaxID=402998 RepID=A0A9Q1MN28_9SOLA|nr:hypothetical protein K7X08_032153 [Anisodus acutangulus]